MVQGPEGHLDNDADSLQAQCSSMSDCDGSPCIKHDDAGVFQGLQTFGSDGFVSGRLGDP